jgi:hypothetical protein
MISIEKNENEEYSIKFIVDEINTKRKNEGVLTSSC